MFGTESLHSLIYIHAYNYPGLLISSQISAVQFSVNSTATLISVNTAYSTEYISMHSSFYCTQSHSTFDHVWWKCLHRTCSNLISKMMKLSKFLITACSPCRTFFFNLTTPQVCYFSTEWVIWTAQYEPSLVHGCLDYRTKCSGFLFFLTYCQPEQQHLVPSDRCQVVALTKIIHVYNHGAWLTNSPHHQILYLYYYLNTLSFSIFVSICQWASLGIPKQLEGI